jgi:hypothetical protein
MAIFIHHATRISVELATLGVISGLLCGAIGIRAFFGILRSVDC